MRSPERLSPKFHSFSTKLRFSVNCSPFGQTFSLEHHPPISQPSKGLYLRNISHTPQCSQSWKGTYTFPAFGSTDSSAIFDGCKCYTFFKYISILGQAYGHKNSNNHFKEQILQQCFSKTKDDHAERVREETNYQHVEAKTLCLP